VARRMLMGRRDALLMGGGEGDRRGIDALTSFFLGQDRNSAVSFIAQSRNSAYKVRS
jgi:hypothetical protein